jgi:hypothetical protein
MGPTFRGIELGGRTLSCRLIQTEASSSAYDEFHIKQETMNKLTLIATHQSATAVLHLEEADLPPVSLHEGQ